MTHMQIDFAAPCLRRTLFRLHPALLIVAVLGALLCIGAAWAGYRISAQLLAHEAQTRRVAERAAAASAKQRARASATPISLQQAEAINAAILHLNLPWRELQDALAAATPPSVALLTLEPDAARQVLKIGAEVKSSDDMIAYIGLLRAQDLFGDVRLTRHEVNERDANRPLRFVLEARWVVR
jgi:Tfp pilus assembly protein PilN